MSPLEALSVMIQAAELAPLTRAGHLTVQQAQAALQEALSPKDVPLTNLVPNLDKMTRAKGKP